MPCLSSFELYSRWVPLKIWNFLNLACLRDISKPDIDGSLNRGTFTQGVAHVDAIRKKIEVTSPNYQIHGRDS